MKVNVRNPNLDSKVYIQDKNFSSERYKKKRSSGDTVLLIIVFLLEMTSCLDYIGDLLILK